MTDRKDFSVTTASDDPAVHLIFLCKMLVTHLPTCNLNHNNPGRAKHAR